ncbi:HET domain containing protein [Zalerion maritima]|uniref:HET domain containing protein n=1 Tax=Zalerion maritima TaxID=339359 RepID=A0AAD5RW70_9PEZI|nr:HET domain containing protein [Zalerion maritima]
MHLLRHLLVAVDLLGLAAEVKALTDYSGVETCPWSQQRPLLSTCVGDGQTKLNFSGSSSSPGQPQHKFKEDDWGWIGPHKCFQKWCLWSNNQFAGGRGISVITLHENMNQVKAIGVNLNNANPLDANAFPPPYNIDEVPGKGLGVIANKIISRGTQVMTYSPVLLVHKEFIDTPTTQKKRQLLDLAVQVLPENVRTKFEAQMSSVGSGAHKIAAILITNSFQMSIPTKDGHHYGNFPEVSRLNHNCRPNTAFHIDENLVHHVNAVQKIKKGEEISISYLDPVAPRDERQKRSLAAWGFSCDCPACSQHNLLVKLSDERLAEIHELESKLQSYGSEGITAKMIERLLKLYKQEKLESRVFGAYTLAALNYNMLGWDRMAVKYAKMAVEEGTIEGGPEAPDVVAMRVLAGDPRGHFTWRGRVGK